MKAVYEIFLLKEIDDTISPVKEGIEMALTEEKRIKRNKNNYKSDKKNCKMISLKFTINTDKDILEKLESEPNKQAYIKQLIRDDIARKNKI